MVKYTSTSTFIRQTIVLDYCWQAIYIHCTVRPEGEFCRRNFNFISIEYMHVKQTTPQRTKNTRNVLLKCVVMIMFALIKLHRRRHIFQPNNIKAFKYKLIHDIIVTNQNLYNWKITDSPNCLVCKCIEDYEHFFLNLQKDRNILVVYYKCVMLMWYFERLKATTIHSLRIQNTRL